MIVKVDPVNPDRELIRKAAAVIRSGGLLVLPTETVYGLAADPFNEDAMEALYRAKGRRPDKPVALFASGIAPIEQAGFHFSAAARHAAESLHP